MGVLQWVSLVCPLHFDQSLLSLRRRETAIVREEGETPNDRNDRGIRCLERLPILIFFEGIRKAAAWYNEHIRLTWPIIRGQAPHKIPIVVLMTEDLDNRQKAEKAGISCISGE